MIAFVCFILALVYFPIYSLFPTGCFSVLAILDDFYVSQFHFLLSLSTLSIVLLFHFVFYYLSLPYCNLLEGGNNVIFFMSPPWGSINICWVEF